MPDSLSALCDEMRKKLRIRKAFPRKNLRAIHIIVSSRGKRGRRLHESGLENSAPANGILPCSARSAFARGCSNCRALSNLHGALPLLGACHPCKALLTHSSQFGACHPCKALLTHSSQFGAYHPCKALLTHSSRFGTYHPCEALLTTPARRLLPTHPS